MKMKNFLFGISWSLCLFTTGKSWSQVVPNSLFADNMVLQRDIKIPVWGKAGEREKVSVTIGQQSVTTTAKDGKWKVELKSLKVGGPYTMTIKGTNTITINNILVGDVWLCGGQSNMERQLGLRPPQKPILNWEAEAAAANYPEIREYIVPHNAMTKEADDANGKWSVCDSVNVKSFSAVSYFFGSELYKKIKIPIGLIHSSVGGTGAEKWTSRSKLESDTELNKIVVAYDTYTKNYPSLLDSFNTNKEQIMAKWVNDTLLANMNKKPIPRKPAPPANPLTSGEAGGLYNAMIAPLIPYPLKGAIWYQGESNSGKPKLYQKLFPTMIADWRERWGLGDFPFLFVQLAPYKGNGAELREAQLKTWLSTPNTAMVVTTDCGDSMDVHPTNKRPVGERLALAARAIAYKEKIEYSGPVFKNATAKGNTMVISFDHVGKGLVAKDGDLKGFTVAGADKKFYPAKAVIEKNEVVVSSDEVPQPAFVRYGFVNYPVVNLYNSEDLPASPFRSNDNDNVFNNKH